MNTIAYLVAVLRTDGTYRLGIFSEERPTTRGMLTTACVMRAEGRDFAEALTNLKARIHEHLPRKASALIMPDRGIWP